MRLKGIIVFVITLFLISCSKREAYMINDGQVYGTFYHVVYQSPGSRDFHPEIQEKFRVYTTTFSPFEKESVISKVNKNEPVELSRYFISCFNRALEISEITGGAFDITVAPMVNAWGFGFRNKETITGELIDSLKNITGYMKVKFKDGRIVKENPNIMLDMSGIAKGYTCDLIGDFLAEKGCENYMVEIGGEVVAKGVNSEGKTWSIGITEPEDDNLFGSSELNAIVRLSGKALATSGNYRNFYIEDGVKYAHTIDPKTGYPVQHSLLSATVLANDCATADAYATAFMVMGLEKGIRLSGEIPDLEVYFIYADESGISKVYYSENFKKSLVVQY